LPLSRPATQLAEIMAKVDRPCRFRLRCCPGTNFGHWSERLTPYPLPTKDRGVLRAIGDARALCLCLFQARHSGRSGCRQARPMRATRATFIRPGHRSYFADSRDWQRPPVVRRWQSVDGFYISAGVFVACAISWPIFFPKLGVSNGATSLQYIQSRAAFSVLISLSEDRLASVPL